MKAFFEEKPYRLGLLCSIVAIILYSNTFMHDYAWDDSLVMTENAYTKQGFDGLYDIWTKRVYLHNRNVYRPIPQTMFAIEYEFFKDSPSVSHIINVLLYALTCFLLFYFLRQLFDRSSPWLLFFIALLYTLHPVHTEVVANIKSRDELLSVLFSIVSMLSIVRLMQKQQWVKWTLVFILSFSAALLSKVGAITLLPVFVLIAYYKSDFSSIFQFLAAPFVYIYDLLKCLGKAIFSLEVHPLSLFVKVVFVAIMIGCIYAVVFNSLLIAIGCVVLLVFLHLKIEHFSFRIYIAFFVLGFSFLMGFTYFFYLYFLITGVFLFKEKKALYFIYAIVFAFGFYFLQNGLFEKIWLLYILGFTYFFNKKRKWMVFGLLVVAVKNLIFEGFELTPYILSRFIAFFFFTIYAFRDISIRNTTLIGSLSLLLVGCASTLHFYTDTYSRDINYFLFEDAPVHVDITPANNEDFTVEMTILNNSMMEETGVDKYASIATIQLKYIQLLIFPYHLVHQYGFNQIPTATLRDWKVWVSIIVHLAMIVFALFFFQRKNKIAFGLALYICTISIYTNIVVLMPDTMAERFLFLPSIGYCIAFVFLLDFILEKKSYKWKVMSGTIALFSIAYFYLAFDRNFDWKDGLTLATNTVKYTPNNATINAQYGAQLNIQAILHEDEVNVARDAAIEQYFLRALELYPGFYSARTDLATFYSRNGKDDLAFPHFIEAIELSPKDWINHYYVGFIYNRRGQYDKAIYHLGEALSIDSKIMEDGEKVLAEGTIARAYYKKGEVQKSIALLEDSYAKYKDKDTYITLANQYQEMGDMQAMLNTLLVLQEDFPEDTDLSSTIEVIRSLTISQ